MLLLTKGIVSTFLYSGFFWADYFIRALAVTGGLRGTGANVGTNM